MLDFGSICGVYILIMITYLLVKHYILDFTCLQNPWMFLNKGKYGHPGGVAHAGLHASLSLPIFIWAMGHVSRSPGPNFLGLSDGWLLVFLLFFELLIHYHMDWFKIWFGKRRKWSEYITYHTRACAQRSGPPGWLNPHLAIYSNNYFSLLGIDQLVHYLTYVAMIVIWIW